MRNVFLILLYSIVVIMIYYIAEVFDVDKLSLIKENSSLKEKIELLEKENQCLKEEILLLSEKVVTVDTYKYLFIFSVLVLILILYMYHKQNGKMEL